MALPHVLRSTDSLWFWGFPPSPVGFFFWNNAWTLMSNQLNIHGCFISKYDCLNEKSVICHLYLCQSIHAEQSCLGCWFLYLLSQSLMLTRGRLASTMENFKPFFWLHWRMKKLWNGTSSYLSQCLRPWCFQSPVSWHCCNAVPIHHQPQEGSGRKG